MRPNVITILTDKRARLLQQKRDVEKDYKQRASELDAEIAKINLTLDFVAKEIGAFLCKRCGGTGTIRVCDAAGSMNDETCPVCGGACVSPDALDTEASR